MGDYVSEIRKVPVALVCDCKSFFDAVNARESAGFGMRDKRSAIETLAIRSSCRETETPVLWVHSDAQIADGRTKGKVSFRLEEFFGAHAQIWRVIFDTATLLARHRKVGPRPAGRDRRQLPSRLGVQFRTLIFGLCESYLRTNLSRSQWETLVRCSVLVLYQVPRIPAYGSVRHVSCCTSR